MTDEDYKELIASLIVSQHGQSSCPPHRTCPRTPRALGGSATAGASPRAINLRPEPDSPLAARLSRAARP
jgi:hypothetical protein